MTLAFRHKDITDGDALRWVIRRGSEVCAEVRCNYDEQRKVFDVVLRDAAGSRCVGSVSCLPLAHEVVSIAPRNMADASLTPGRSD